MTNNPKRINFAMKLIIGVVLVLALAAAIHHRIVNPPQITPGILDPGLQEAPR